MERYNKFRRDSIELARKKFIEDSIAREKVLEEIRIKREKINKDRELTYKANHIWKSVPTGKIKLYCPACDKSIAKDSLISLGIKNDSIYFLHEQRDIIIKNTSYYMLRKFLQNWLITEISSIIVIFIRIV